MVTEIVATRHLPLEEVLGWRWRRLHREYQQVARNRWDQQMSQIMALETALARVLGPAFGGKKPQALPPFEKVYQDPFAPPPPPPMQSAFWQAYKRANKVDEFADQAPENQQDG